MKNIRHRVIIVEDVLPLYTGRVYSPITSFGFINYGIWEYRKTRGKTWYYVSRIWDHPPSRFSQYYYVHLPGALLDKHSLVIKRKEL